MPSENDVVINIKSYWDRQGVVQATLALKALDKDTKRMKGALQSQGKGIWESFYGRAAGQTGNDLFSNILEQIHKEEQQLRRNNFLQNIDKSLSLETLAKEAKKGSDSFKKLKRELALGKAPEDWRNTAKEMDKLRQRTPGLFKNMRYGANLAGNELRGMERWLSKAGTAALYAGSNFDMTALSGMFMWMQIGTILSKVMSASIDAFKTIASYTNPAVQGLNMLEGALTVLKFSLGETLANFILPMIPGIMAFVDSILVWIDKNQQLVGYMFTWGFALAKFAAIWYSFKLGINSLLIPLGRMALGLASLFDGMETGMTTGAKFSKFWDNLSGKISKPLKAGITVALAAVAVFESYKILTQDGTSLGEYAMTLGTWTAAGAAIGAWFGGWGALVGAAAGLTAGAIVVATDVVLEIKHDKERIMADFNMTMDEVKKAMAEANKQRQDEVTKKYDLDARDAWGNFLMSPDQAAMIRQDAKISYDELYNIIQKQRDESLVNRLGGKDATINEAIKVKTNMEDIANKAASATDYAEQQAYLDQVRELSKEYDNLIRASGASADDINVLTQNQIQARDSASQLSSQQDTLNKAMQQTTEQFKLLQPEAELAKETLAGLVMTSTPDDIIAVGVALDETMKKLNETPFDIVDKMASAFAAISEGISGTSEKKGLSGMVTDMFNSLVTGDTSLLSALNTINGKLYELSTTLSTTFKTAIDTATTALLQNANAANSAAAAQRNYNDAINGL
jgi:hypothetical protein